MYILLHVLKTLSLEMNSNKPPAILTHLDILGIKKKLLQLGGGDNFIMGHWEGVGAFFFFFLPYCHLFYLLSEPPQLTIYPKMRCLKN